MKAMAVELEFGSLPNLPHGSVAQRPRRSDVWEQANFVAGSAEVFSRCGCSTRLCLRVIRSRAGGVFRICIPCKRSFARYRCL